MDFGSFKAGDEVPWNFGIPELPPLALACMAMVEPGTDSMFSVLAAGAHAASIWVQENTGYQATTITAHCKGLDLPAWDPRGKRGNAVAYMTSNIGASHMRAGYKEPTGLPNASAVDLMPELIQSQNEIVIRDSMILCAFAKGATPNEVMLDAYNAITGENATWDQLLQRAATQWDLARAWNQQYWDRLGKLPDREDLLSYRLRKDPLPDGIAKGMVSFVSDDDEQACIKAYYRLRGWSDEGRVARSS